MENQFTPGPWEAYEASGAGWSVRIAYTHEGYTGPYPICSMAWWQFDKPGIIDNEISKANAKLIASAPVLYRALEQIAGGDCMNKSIYSHADVIQEHYRIARNALKQIEG
jgi:hypothetical protein